MQIRFHNILIISLVTLIQIAWSNDIIAQRPKSGVFWYGFQLMPGYSSSTINPRPPELTSFTSQMKPEINFGILGQYFFNPYIGLETGAFILTHHVKASGYSFSTTYETTDSENETYERIITGDSIHESTTIRTLNIPLNLVYNYKLSKRFTFYASAGPGIAFPVQKTVKGSGLFSYKGYYPATHVTLEKVPYNFNDSVPVSSNENLNTNKMILFASVSAGFNYSINSQYKVFIGAGYYATLTKITRDTGKTFHVSDDLGKYNSFLYNWKKPLSAMSIIIGLNIKLETDN